MALITVKQVASKLGLSTAQVHAYIRQDRIPVAVRNAKLLLIDPATLKSLKIRRPGRPKKIL